MMDSLPLLSITIFLPLLGALVILLNWGNKERSLAINARWVALWTSLVTFVLALILWLHFNPISGEFQFEEKLQWMPLLDISYHVGLDGISLPLFLLSALLILIAVLVSWSSIQTKVPEYMMAFFLLKMGGYCFIRFSIPMFPEASSYFTPLIFTLSIIAIIYMSLVALAQQDMKKLIAYASVAHMCFVTLGIFTVDSQGMEGAIMQMVSHGLVSAALFICVGVVYDRLHSREIAAYGGLVHTMPRYATFFMFFILASIGLPGTSGFVGEFLVLLGTFQVNSLATVLASTGMVLGAAYALWLYRRVMFSPLVKPSLKSLSDLNWREDLVFAPLAVSVLVLGLYPLPILTMAEASVVKVIDHFNLALEGGGEELVDTEKTLEIALVKRGF